VTEAQSPKPKPRGPITSGWDLDRIYSLLKSNLEEIEQEQRYFFGTLKLEVNFREGEIETVAVERRQTFKN
jgi:hypothetical protein